MYLGRFQVGEDVPLGVLCTDAALVPELPDAAPGLEVYAAAGHALTTGQLVPADRTRAPGLFRGSVYLDGRFAPGAHAVVYHWAVAGVTRVREDRFEVAAGGDGAGAAVAMTYYPTPQADYLVRLCDSGRLLKGRGPGL